VVEMKGESYRLGGRKAKKKGGTQQAEEE